MTLMQKTLTLITVSLIVLLTACGEKLTALKTSNVDNVFPSGQTQSQLAPPPTAVTDALLPDFNQTLVNANQHTTAQTFNIAVHGVEARDFFMSLVADSQENMVVHPEVSGHISLELKNVTVAQVLNTVQKVYGYDYTKSDIGYIIYPATLQTKIFKIDRLDIQREGSSNTRVSSGQINNGPRAGQPIPEIWGQCKRLRQAAEAVPIIPTAWQRIIPLQVVGLPPARKPTSGTSCKNLYRLSSMLRPGLEMPMNCIIRKQGLKW